MIDTGGSAFPSEQHENQDNTWNQTFDPGMTLRDWFAGNAMQGMCASPAAEWTWKARAESAYRMADAMLEARKS